MMSVRRRRRSTDGRDVVEMSDVVLEESDEPRYGEVTDRHVLICSKINYDIIVGDLVDSTEETVVNSTGDDVNLSVSVAKALAQKAGPGFRTAAKALAPLAVEAVGETAGFDMPCKQILHCNCPPSKSTNDKEPLKKIMNTCLQMASRKGHQSIAFPSLGMGVKRYSANIVAESMIETITKYSQKNPHSPITAVKLYLCKTEIKQSQLEAFTRAMRMLGRRPYGFSLPNDTRLDIFKGDLAEVKVGIIVNSTSSGLQLSVGKISSALLRKAGQEMQDECKGQAPIKVGDLAVTGGHGLACSSVLHASCPNWRAGETEKALRALIIKCLTWANDFKEASIAFPALGTGLLEYPPEAMAECFLQASTDYAKDNPRSRVKQIMLVAFTDDAKTIKGIEKSLGMKLDVQQHEVRQKKPAAAAETKMREVYALPSTWAEPVNTYREVPLVKDGQEWKDVEGNFKRTLGKRAVVLQIQRVQNPMSYTLYEVTKQSVAANLNKPDNQVETRPLWHGTSASSVRKIARTKFDRGLSGAVGGNMLGAGSYFSTTSNYSAGDPFSPANDAGERFMIQAKVITGEYCKGKSDLKQAPYKNSYEQYDSVVNDESDPTMYAVFHDTYAYPEYIIKYKLVATERSCCIS